MAELFFEEHADSTLTALEEADPSKAWLLERINEVLDLLEDDPGDEGVRRRRYLIVDAGGVPVSGDSEEWLILWDLQADSVVLRYLGPDL